MVNQQEALTTIGQLTTGFAHDFNNLMGTIIGQVELMRLEGNLSSETQAGLSQIVHSSQQAAQRLRQILDFSRKSMAFAPTVDICTWLTNFSDELSRHLPPTISFATDITKIEAYCKISLEQLHQIMLHIIANAQEAMPTGGKLKIHASIQYLTSPALAPHPKMEAGNWFVIQVSDTGAGIPGKLIPQLHEPFFTTKEGHLGLGLAQAYSIIKQYNGYLSINSQLGKGTNITLYFPMQRTDGEHNNLEGLPFQRGQGQQLLLVEDEPMVLKVTETMLTRLGYQVFAASSGLTALHLYEQYQDQIALVLTDLSISDFNGMSLVAQLTDQNPDVKIIALTGHRPDTDTQILATPGIVSWVQKPLDITQLSQLLSQWVS